MFVFLPKQSLNWYCPSVRHLKLYNKYQKNQDTLNVQPLCGSCCTMMALISHDCHQMPGKLCCSTLLLLLLCQIIRIVLPCSIYEHIKHFTAITNTKAEGEKGRERETGRTGTEWPSESAGAIYMLVATLTRILLANIQHRRASCCPNRSAWRCPMEWRSQVARLLGHK